MPRLEDEGAMLIARVSGSTELFEVVKKPL